MSVHLHLTLHTDKITEEDGGEVEEEVDRVTVV